MDQKSPRKNRLIPIHPQGWPFLLPPLLLALILGLLGWAVGGLLLLAVALVVAAFFRDPPRHGAEGGRGLLAPADGKVLCVEEIEIQTPDGEQRRLRRVGIFLSVLDVHVQRAPVRGRVRETRYTRGRFLNALKPEAAFVNENNLIWIESERGWVGVRQIAGLIARRVVCTVREGQALEQGCHIGIIRFGSQADLYFPLEARVLVAPGERVRGGRSLMAEWPAGEAGNA